MSKSRKKLDSRQLNFDFERRIDEYTQLRSQILEAPSIPRRCAETWEEACIEVAAAAKRAIRASGLSRDQVVDLVNQHFGWTGSKSRSLSLHMLNHYLSKPARYPIPAAYIFALQRVTNNLELCRALAEAAGARVISGDQVRQAALGKLDETILEMQQLKRELLGKK